MEATNKNEKENKQVLLKEYVKGYPKETDFELTSSVMSLSLSMHESEAVLLQNLYLACDPYLRHRISDSVSNPGTIINSLAPGSVIMGYGVAKVIQSTHPDFQEGDLVWGLTGWEEFTVLSNPKILNKIRNTDLPPSFYLGVLGMVGLSAYVGLMKLCCPKKGETVYVSTAAGGVGQIVGQFAKMLGCYVVGSTSTDEKVTLAKTKFRYDEAFNYKEHDVGAALTRHCPGGIDVYFDNVGGKMLDEVLKHMKPHGRIAACGMISLYNLYEPVGVGNMFSIISKRLEIKGYVEIDYRHVYSEYLELAIKYLKEGKLVYIEDVAQGLENAPPAFVGIFYGRNIGKQVVRVAHSRD